MTYQDRSNASAFLGMKAPVKVASTGTLTLSGEQTIDGIACTDGDRVLYKNGTTDNGIYIVRTGAWERAPDWDGNDDVFTGTMVFVPRGTTNARRLYYVSTTGSIVVGTTSVTLTLGTTLS